jgi:hypothetical protein
MADENDRAFYDTALAAYASLSTGNMKHYPAGPPIISPAEFAAGMPGRYPPGGLNQMPASFRNASAHYPHYAGER